MPSLKMPEPAGRGWPARPGVPAFPDQTGWHWLAWPGSGRVFAAQWVGPPLGFWADWLAADAHAAGEMASFDYVGQAEIPANPHAPMATIRCLLVH